jgi:exodeoxyribonuclease VII small subunit
MPKKSSKKEFTFEEAVAELEEIVVSMEEDQLPLQVLIDKFERGAKLHKDCETFLNSAKKRLEVIANDVAEKPADSPPQSLNNDNDEIRLF